MRTRWIKYMIWLLAINTASTLGAVIQSETTSSAPQSSTTVTSVVQNNERNLSKEPVENQKSPAVESSETSFRSEKAQSNATAIGESIKMVASQLLKSDKTPPPPSKTAEQTVTDTRTPPFMKNQQVVKTKVTSNKLVTSADEPKHIENSHAGVAIPITAEEMEKEVKTKLQNNTKKPIVKESTTTGEGLSTWILLNGKPSSTTIKPESKNKNENKENSSKENKKSQTKAKTTPKPTRSPTLPQIKPIFVRKPVLISSNKSDLIASGSAVDENEMNKIKATVLASVQKNAALGKTTTPSDVGISTEIPNKESPKQKEKDTSKEVMVKINPIKIKEKKKVDVKEKPQVKENVVTVKVEDNEEIDSLESKTAEIELPVSTPASKPKSKKKNKNRKRKPSSSTKLETKEDNIKNKDTKIKINKTEEGSTDVYNFISRKVIQSVGIGLVSLAGIFGIASYFFNPFGAVRRSDNLIERKDLYHYNDEQYADDGGQREEDVLGSLFPDVPADNKIPNSNIRQNTNRYPVQPTQFTYPKPKISPSSTEQNVRYRKVGYGPESSNFVSNDRIGPKTPDIIQGTAYSESIHYDTHSNNDNREPYTVYAQSQPVYKSPDRQVDNSEYSSDHVYHAVSPYSSYHQLETSYDQPLQYNHEMFDTTNSPMTNVHLTNEDVIEHQKETGYTVDALAMDNDQEPQFVVGNVPKELIEATPVTVPEHGPRSLRIRRSVVENTPEPKIESAAESLKNILREAPKDEEDEMSNEIDDMLIQSYKADSVNSMANEIVDSYRNESTEKYSSEEISSTIEAVTENSTTEESSTKSPSSIPANHPHNEAHHPHNHDHQYPFIDFIRGLLDFKLRLGISILKTTSDNIARYLKDIENNFNITAPVLSS